MRPLKRTVRLSWLKNGKRETGAQSIEASEEREDREADKRSTVTLSTKAKLKVGGIAGKKGGQSRRSLNTTAVFPCQKKGQTVKPEGNWRREESGMFFTAARVHFLKTQKN